MAKSVEIYSDPLNPLNPLIAIAWPRPDYVTSIERAGGRVRVLDPARDALPASLDGCDGVLLTGGADVDPREYGEAPHPTVELEPERDTYEFALTRAALQGDLPLLAICRGAQVLNVVAGGTLVQDIPTHDAAALSHSVSEPKAALVHDVTIVPGSCLARLVVQAAGQATDHVAVNSRHHQSVKDVAPGFVVTATAPDGVVEAIERPDRDFCVGVQWHPENFWATGEFRGIFEGFVAAARRHRGVRS